MFPFNFQNTIIAAMVAFVLGGLVSGIGTYRYEEARWTAAIEAQKVEAAHQLQAATERVLEAERAYRRINDDLEKTHAENQTALDRAYADARRTAAAAGGLRDPGRGAGGGGSVPTGSTAACLCPGGASQSRLSGAADEFLWQFARDADATAQYAADCHAWAMKIGEHQ